MIKKPFNLSKAIIPNTFTAFNIFSGFLSIVFASEKHFDIAVILIIVAGLFDAIDGIVARLVNTSSKFGVELDSLSDIVSFGAAPSFLLYEVYLHQFGWMGMVLSSLPIIFGSFRLARFNVQLEDVTIKTDFRGLPIPVAAITIGTFVFTFQNNNTIENPIAYLVIPLTLLISLLMVSTIRYDAIPKPKNLSSAGKTFLIIFLMIAIFVTLYTEGKALFYIFLSIVLFGIFRKLYELIFKKKDSQVQIDEELN